MVLGFDTSNYTTSVAISDGVGGKNCSRLFGRRPGELGLRQSEALFAHVKRLPELARALFAEYPGAEITAIGASTRREGCGGVRTCRASSRDRARQRRWRRALGVPFHAVSHQQGHVAAALWSAGRMELMDAIWHGICPAGRRSCCSSRRKGRTSAPKSSAERATSPPDSSSTGRASCLIAVSGGQGARCAEPGGGCGGGFPCEGEWADVLVLRAAK